ncbi:hypothetical protein [Streptomyces sp. RFCAC02]|uniref:hypothetical protein n=1 Tax=Streptomyces sp. RFCAC02 TaxID=2499143 RepID=UPI0010208EDB|nr:hypothetical protein [Streptomyces sp. RFCAC02]
MASARIRKRASAERGAHGVSRAAGLVLTAVLLTGCASGEGLMSGSVIGGVWRPVAEVCDGTLDEPAYEALEQLSGLPVAIDEGGGPADEDGSAPAPDLEAFAGQLRDAPDGPHMFCTLTDTTDMTVDSYAEMTFTWYDVPTGEQGTGPAAYVTAESGDIFFLCPGGPEETLRANFLMLSRPAGGDADASLTVTNSVARAVAEELGCLEASGLTTAPPEPTSTE